MNWGSLENFLAMGGYGFYVWGSYLATFGLLVVEPMLLAQRKRRLLSQLRARAGVEREGA